MVDSIQFLIRICYLPHLFQAKNMKLVKQLHEEQESCVELKVQIRMLVSTQQEP